MLILISIIRRSYYILKHMNIRKPKLKSFTARRPEHA